MHPKERLPAASATRTSDTALLDLLRAEAGLGIAELSRRMGVTATAVRQRLDRLMHDGLVGRSVVAPTAVAGSRWPRGRGRPGHVYSLTDKGRRSTGDNFRDLAFVLWQEIRGIREPAVRNGLMARLGSALADLCHDQVSGSSPVDRLESTAEILRQKRIPCAAEAGPAGLPVLTNHACPYPDLAEQDRGVCAVERIMLEKLVGSPVRLTECRLDGDDCCRFTVAQPDHPVPRAAAPCIETH